MPAIGKIPYAGQSPSAVKAANEAAAKKAESAGKEAVSTEKAQNTDVVEKQAASQQTTGVYNKSAVANKSAYQMKNDALKDYVKDTLAGQQYHGYKPLNGKSPIVAGALNAAEKSSEKYDDYWGVDATAERIYTFARTLAGDNDKMFATMKNAFEKGFKQALGQRKSLPEISYRTRDKVLEHFDSWEKEIKDKRASAAAQADNKTNSAAK